MMKRRFVCILMCALLLLSCTAVAEQTAIAPEVVPGRIMGYVINNEGAEVYEDIYSAEATMEPVKTYEYGTEIEIQKLGLGYCRVRSDDNKVLFVRTRDLSFSNEPFGSQLAIVFVKRSKVLPLHKTDSAKSKRVTDVPDGSYVVVLEKGATFSHVLYGKYEGYLQNAYLSFREAWPDDVQQAILRNPDQPKRHMTINLRSADSLNGKKVTTLPTYNKKTKSNTILTVLQIKGEWAEIEADKTGKGIYSYIHGYLKSSWVEALEPAPAAETEKEPEGETKPEEAKTEEATEDVELKEGAAMEEPDDEASVPDDEEEPVEAEEALEPEWDEGE